MKHAPSGQQGFTLVEVMIAMFILGVALLTLITMQVTGIKGNSTANQISIASDWGSGQIEKIFGLGYSDPELTDAKGDGLAGLNNMTAATADHSYVSPDGVYTVCWNVIDDRPMANLKTVRIIVIRTDQGQDKSVTMNYIKAKYQ